MSYATFSEPHQGGTTIEDELLTSASIDEDEFSESDLLQKTEDYVPEKQFLSPTLFASIRRKASITTGSEKQEHNNVFDLSAFKCDHLACGGDGQSQWIVMPWSRTYQSWWTLTVFATAVTFFFETHAVAFSTHPAFRPYQSANCFVEYILTGIFVIDIVIQSRLAYYNHRDELELDPRKLFVNYVQRGHFWMDVLAILPLEFVVLAIEGKLGEAPSTHTRYVTLLRLARLFRLYRIKDYFEILSVNMKISLMKLTLIRNLAAAFSWLHLAACVMFFIAQQLDKKEESFLGAKGVHGMKPLDQYVTALYWAAVTFSTVGYGDLVAYNTAERVWCVVYILFSIIMQAWIIGSITLLLIKKDEKTGDYRDTLETLDKYARIHSFDEDFHKRLMTQLSLDFNTREICDESVLKHFPASIRRKVLRRLYLPYLMRTDLMMKNVRLQFVDAFLSASRVEIFPPGEEIIHRHAISSDLYLLVGGEVEIVAGNHLEEAAASSSTEGKKTAEFLNDIGFFTESPEIYTVRTTVVCKTLTISKASYKLLSQDHPGGAGKILQNLLDKIRLLSEKEDQKVPLPRSPSNLSMEDSTVKSRNTIAAVQDLVEMHILRLKDDDTTRFLNSAARGDIQTLNVMCDQGFDPNSSDYDSRTALMVASMKGNKDVVTKLLEYGADPNLVDMHGSSALYEAVRMGHEETMQLLLDRGGSLCMGESLAASKMDQAVFDGDIGLLRRLLEAKIPVNAADYDQRRPVHIAAAEGNITALKLMIEHGADLGVEDRWGNTANDEAKRVKAGHLTDYLDKLV